MQYVCVEKLKSLSILHYLQETGLLQQTFAQFVMEIAESFARPLTMQIFGQPSNELFRNSTSMHKYTCL